MQITLEKLIQLVTAEVVKELKKQNVTVISGSGSQPPNMKVTGALIKSEVIDMSQYKTPVLTENHVRRLHELTGEIIVPIGTIITPKAKELIRDRNIQICEKAEKSI